jgi:hypothetical protein
MVPLMTLRGQPFTTWTAMWRDNGHSRAPEIATSAASRATPLLLILRTIPVLSGARAA